MGGHIAASQAMNADPLADVRKVAARHPNVRLYVFGSALHTPETAIDLDVLAVYQALEDYEAFELDLDRLAISSLTDLVAMTPAELSDSGFLARSRAVTLEDFQLRRCLNTTADAPADAPAPGAQPVTKRRKNGDASSAMAGMGRWDSYEQAHIIDTAELGLPQASLEDDTQAMVLIAEWKAGRLPIDPLKVIPLDAIDASVQGTLRREVLERYFLTTEDALGSQSSWGADGPLAVRLVGGRTVLIDGNHRWAVATIRGDATFRAQILRAGPSFSDDTDWRSLQLSQLAERRHSSH